MQSVGQVGFPQEASPADRIAGSRRRYAVACRRGVFNVPCWFSVLLVGGSGMLRLLSPPPAGQHPLTPHALILAGLLFPLWHLYAACSPTTFLDLSRHSLRRSVCGRVSSWRWDRVAPFKVRSRGPRIASWLTVEMQDERIAAMRLDGPWTTFFFGGLDIGSLAEGLNAWRAWATSESTTPPPSLEPNPHDSFPLWVMLELWLGFLACLTFASILAIGSPNGFAHVIGSLLSFAITSLLFAPLAVVIAGPTRIRRHAVIWQLGWITFVLVAAWLGHFAISFIPAFQQMPPLTR